MRIHLISSPRNVSTALMYSFAQRPDVRVVDEPFYAYYLDRSGAEHPGRAEVLASQPRTVDGVFRTLDGQDDRPHLFLKGMAHHCEGIALDRLATMTSVLFIRDPRKIIASFAEVIPNPTLRDIGIRIHVELLEQLKGVSASCVVLDSDDLLADPEAMLTSLCDRLGIGFDERMLKWTAGPRLEDGVWAPHWYANVHRSTGFTKQATSDRPVPENLRPLLAEALPFYETLRAERITA
ncbi:MAG: sulfotransferase family protein [Flavobacteriales bacterium]